MYLLLTFCCPLVGMMGMALGPYASQWGFVAPYFGANLLAAWAGLRGGRLYPLALILVCVDVGVMIVLLLGIGVIGLTRGGPSAWSAVILVPVIIGLLLCIPIESYGGSKTSLLPLRGEWGRRFLAGLVVLLMQPASPGSGLILFIYAQPFGRPEELTSQWWMSLWLISSLLYLAPIYRRIVEGVPAQTARLENTSQVPTLGELLLHDRRTMPQQRRAFARLVLRIEKRLHAELVEGGRHPDDAARRVRAILRSQWLSPTFQDYDALDFGYFRSYLEDTRGELAPVGCHKILVDLALAEHHDGIRLATQTWLEDPERFESLIRIWGVPRDVAIRRVHVGVEQLLTRISAGLPERPPSAKGTRSSHSGGDERCT